MRAHAVAIHWAAAGVLLATSPSAARGQICSPDWHVPDGCACRDWPAARCDQANCNVCGGGAAAAHSIAARARAVAAGHTRPKFPPEV